MSVAGSRSWQGDEFQLRIALHYLIRLLDGQVVGLQVESNGLPGQEGSISVDDVVAVFADGKCEYVQAKKNQPDHESWKLKDRVLREELTKARDQLEADLSGTVRFFSRSPFGAFKKLQEQAQICPDEQAFRRDTGRAVQESLDELASLFDRSDADTLALLRRVRFGATREFEEWDAENRKDLERFLPSCATALSVLERFLASHQSRLRDSRFVIRREDVLGELARHELVPAPMYNEQETLTFFGRASQIGRTWLRDIAGTRLKRPELYAVLAHIRARAKTVLVAAGPGSGKTCLLLDVADQLEADGVTAVLFIKGDRFASVEDEARLKDNGLPPDIVGRCARLAVSRPVAVLLDSLDVLSISRNHGSLRVFLGLIERLEKLDGVSVVAACRDFDVRYDPQLRARQWQARVPLALLDYPETVAPLLKQWGVDPTALSADMRKLVSVPQHLRLFSRLARSGETPNLVSPFQLYERFIHEAAALHAGLGDATIRRLEDLAASGVHQRRQTFPRASLDVTGETLQQLVSSEILIEESGRLAFAHQSIAESLAVRRALREGQTLARFVLDAPPLPFVRPTVRAFFFYLRSQDPRVFRRQVWDVLTHAEVAYHLKRLVAESLAETFPDDDDAPLVRRLFTHEPALFQRTLAQARNTAWFDLLRKHWLPVIRDSESAAEWRYRYVSGLDRWLKSRPGDVIEIWTEALETGWAPEGSAWTISVALSHLSAWSIDGLQKLFELLVAHGTDRGMLSKPLSLWISATNKGDELLWQLMTQHDSADSDDADDERLKIRCGPHSFHDDGFLARRLERSDQLLTLVTVYLMSSAVAGQANSLSHSSLHKTSWERRHTRWNTLHADGATILLEALERAVKKRAQHNDNWWRQHEPRLRHVADLGIRYLLIEAYLENPTENVAGIEAQLTDRLLFRGRQLEYELGVLMAGAYGYLSDEAQDRNQDMILELVDDFRGEDGSLPSWAAEVPYQYSLWIPRSLRSPRVAEFVSRWADEFGSLRPSPRIHSWGGAVGAPVSRSQLANLDDNSVLRILRHYLGSGSRETELLDHGGFVGGLSEVQTTVCQCAAYEPGRFLNLLHGSFDQQLRCTFGPSIVEGIAEHLSFASGAMSAPEGWSRPIGGPPLETLARALLKFAERAFLDERPLSARSEYTVSRVLQAVTETTETEETGERVTLALWRMVNSESPELRSDSEASEFGMVSYNSTRGVVARAAMTLYRRWLELGKTLPRLLLPLLRRFALDPVLGVRVSILTGLPFLIHHKPEVGWALFDDAFRDRQSVLWVEAERILYYQYRSAFQRVGPLLERIGTEAPEVAGETLGRIATLCYLAGHAVTGDRPFLALAANDAIRKGISQVLCANLGDRSIAAECRAMLVEMMQASELSSAAIEAFVREMADENADRVIDTGLVMQCVRTLSHSQVRDIWGVCKWLERNCGRHPLVALDVCETLVALQGDQEGLRFSDELVRVLLEILREADETDDPELITRAVKLQDDFLRMGVTGIDELLDNSALT